LKELQKREKEVVVDIILGGSRALKMVKSEYLFGFLDITHQ